LLPGTLRRTIQMPTDEQEEEEGGADG